MPNDIENRVVKLSFDNKSFEQNASESMKTLSKLKDSLDFNGIAEKLEKAFNVIENIGSGTLESFSKIPDHLNDGFEGLKDSIKGIGETSEEIAEKTGEHVEFIADKIQSLTSIVGKVADKIKDDIANKIKSTLREMTVGQLSAGAEKYEKETRAVQTITNATGKSVEEVDEVLKKLMKYTDETSYDFAEMVSSIGKFTSVGVDLNLAEKAMEGIANEAAKSGAGVQEANRAMYNFAQALSAGYVKLIDWKSIENANMATKEFKEQLIATAIELGTLEKKGENIGSVVTTNEKSLEAGQAALKKASKATKDRAEKIAAAQKKIADATKKVEVNYKTFNETLSGKWLTSDVLVKTLEKYSDTSTEFGLNAFHAAQEALTFKDAMEATKDAISSGWMQTMQYVFGNLDEARVLWTKVANGLYDFVAIFSEFRNNLLGGWHDLGGYTAAVEAASNVWHSFMDVLHAVGDAFGEVFPPLTAERLVGWTNKVRDLTAEFRNMVGVQEDLSEDSDEDSEQTEKNVKYYIEYDKDVNKAWDMTKELKKGDIGKEVKALQNELKNARYLPKDYIANGIYNDETEAAIKKLQRDMNVKVTGSWDKATRAATYSNKEFVEIAKYRQRITADWISEGKNVIAVYNKQIDVAKRLNNTINKSSRTSDIKELQEELIKAGYMADSNGATGIYGPETEMAVKKLQAALNVDVTGSWNEATKAAASAKKVFVETKEVEEKVNPGEFAQKAAEAYSNLTAEEEKALEANKRLAKALSKTGSHTEVENWFAKDKEIKTYKNKEGKTTYFYDLDSNVDMNSLRNLQKASIKTESDLTRLDRKANEIKNTTLRVQNALVHYGYLADASLANGIYGPETKEAVKKLQKDLGVEVTGAWDTATQVAVRDSGKFTKEITKMDWRETLIARIQEYVKGFASAIDTIKKIVLGGVRFVAGLATIFKPLIDPIARLGAFISKMFQNMNKGVASNKLYGFVDNLLMLFKPVADVIRWIGNGINSFLDGYREFIAGLDGGIVKVGKDGKKVVNSGLISFKTFFEYIIQSIKNSPIFGFIGRIAETAIKVAAVLVAVVAKLVLTIASKIVSIKKIFDDLLSIDGIEGKLKYLQALFTTYFGGLAEKLKDTPLGKIVIGWINVISGKISKFKEAWQHFLEIDGIKGKVQYIFNLISGFVTNIKTLITNSKIWEYFTNIPAVQSIIKFFDGIRERVTLFIDEWKKVGEIDGIQGKIQYIFGLIKGYISNIITYLSGTEFGKFVAETFDNIRSIVASKMAALGDEIGTWAGNLFEQFKESAFGKTVIGIVTTVANIFTMLVNKVNEVFPNFTSGIVDAWNGILTTLADGTISFADKIKSIVEIIKTLVVGAIDAVKSKWEQLKETYPIINAIGSLLSRLVSGVVGVLSGVSGSITKIFSGSSVAKAGKYATEGIAKGMTKTVSKVTDAGSAVAQAAIEGITGPKGLDEHSPSKVTEGAGEYASEGLAKGMINSKDQVETAAENVADSIEQPFRHAGDNIANAIPDGSILGGILNALNEFVSFVNEVGLEKIVKTALSALAIFAALKTGSGIKKFGAGILNIGKGFGKVSEGLTKNLDTITAASQKFLLGADGKNDIAQIIKESVEKFTKAEEEAPKDSLGTTLLKIAGSIALVTAALFVLSKTDTAKVAQGAIALGAIVGVITLCTFALSKMDGENVEKLGSGLLHLVKAVGLLVVSILGMNILVANTSGGTLAKSIGIIAGFILSLALIEVLLAKFGSSSKAGVVDVKVSGIVSICGGIGILVLAIGSLTRTLKKYGTGEVLLALDSIKSLLTRLGIIEVLLAFLGKGSRTGIVSVKISGLLNMCLGIYILALATERMAKAINKYKNYDEAFDMMGSLLFKLGALEVILTFLNIFNKGSKVKISGILGMAAGIYLVSIALGKIAADYEKFKSYEEAFDLLSSILVTLSVTSLLFVGALAALSAIGVGGALQAVGALVIFFGITTGLGLLVGAINNWTNGGLLDLLVEGGKTIGAGIGAFINAFEDGLTGGEKGPSLIERLRGFAVGLSGAMDDLKPFFEKCESITRKQTIGVGYLISAILKMTGANMLDAVSSWVGGINGKESSGSGFVDFANNLVSFADPLIEFVNKISGTEVDGVKTGGLDVNAITNSVPAIQAMDTLAQACAGIAWGELKTKVFEVIAGDNSIVTFAEKMALAGPKLVAYGNSLNGINTDDINKSAVSIEALGRAASAIPAADGVMQSIFGNHDIDKFGNKLGALGFGLWKFATITGFIKSGYDATPYITALEGLVGIAQRIPASAGYLQKAFGDKSLDDFGGQLGKLGLGLAKFVFFTGYIDKDYDASHLITVLDGLATIQDKIYASGGTVSKFFGGEKDLGVFGDQIVVLADKLIEFEGKAGDVTVSKFETIGTALSSLANAVLMVPSIGNATDLAYAAEGIIEVFTRDTLFSSGKSIIDHIVEGVEAIGNADKLKESINTVLSDAIKKVNATYSDMKTSPAIKPGEYVDDGLVKGIENHAANVSKAILKVVNDALEAAKGPKGLDEHSPSKATEEMGDYAGEGFAVGLNKSSSKVEEAAKGVAETVKDSIEPPSEEDIKNTAEAYVDAYADGLDEGTKKVKRSKKKLDKVVNDQNESIEKQQEDIEKRKTVIGSTNYTGAFYYYKTEKKEEEEDKEDEKKKTYANPNDWNNRVNTLQYNYDKMNDSAVKGINTNKAAKTLADNTAASLAEADLSDAGDALTDNLGSSISTSLEGLGGDDDGGPFSNLLEHLGEGITNLFSGDNPENPFAGLGDLFGSDDSSNPLTSIKEKLTEWFNPDNKDNPFSGVTDLLGGLLGDGEGSIWDKVMSIVSPDNPDNPFAGVMETLSGFLTGDDGLINKVKGFLSPDNADNPLMGIYDTVAGFLNPDNPNGLIKEGKRLVARMFGLEEGEEAAETAVDGVETVLTKELDSEQNGSKMSAVKEVAGKSLTDALCAQDNDKAAANMSKSAKALNNVISTEVDRSPVITPVIDYSQINGSAAQIRDLVGIDSVATSINAQNSGALATSAAIGQVGNTVSELKTAMTNNQKMMNTTLDFIAAQLGEIDEDLTKLKIYLDSDALVAGTVEKMDKALGKRYFRGSKVK